MLALYSFCMLFPLPSHTQLCPYERPDESVSRSVLECLLEKVEKTPKQSEGKSDSQRISSAFGLSPCVNQPYLTFFEFVGCQSPTHSTQALLELREVMISPLRFYMCLMVLEHRLQTMRTGDWQSTASWWQVLLGNAIQQFYDHIR